MLTNRMLSNTSAVRVTRPAMKQRSDICGKGEPAVVRLACLLQLNLRWLGGSLACLALSLLALRCAVRSHFSGFHLLGSVCSHLCILAWPQLAWPQLFYMEHGDLLVLI